MLNHKWARRFGLGLLVFSFFAASGRGATFNIQQSASPASPSIGSNLLFTTELSSSLPNVLTGISVTNVLPASVRILAVTVTNSNATFTTNGNVVVFQISPPISPNQTNILSVLVSPTAVGPLTNVVSAFMAGTASETNSFTATVGSGAASTADLGVFVLGPTQPPVIGDILHYTITATNAGPNSATGVVITNTFAPGVTLLSANPTNSSFNGQVLAFDVGTLATGAIRTFDVSVQATNSGNISSTAVISAPGNNDTNNVNDSSTAVTAIAGVDAVLVATRVSDMVLNRQNGLMEQIVQISNNTTSSVPAARLVLSNFTFRVFNAVGTNQGAPYVLYQSAIPAGATVTLVLEYFIPGRTPVDDPTFFAFGVPAVNATAPTNGVDATIRMTFEDTPRPLIEFPSEPGKSYRIVYSENVNFTGALFAQPDVIAPANRTQWIDSGPPKTVANTNSTTRFYRVFQAP
jgi:uncharacterized repeat protein (TIGR01451 family)